MAMAALRQQKGCDKQIIAEETVLQRASRQDKDTLHAERLAFLEEQALLKCH